MIDEKVEREFLDAILANRADVGPRLVYADWLVERGDPRGEFIHVQCRLDAMERYDPNRRALERREKELLDAHGTAWRRPAKEFASSVTFRRGFVEHVAVPMDTFLAWPDRCLDVGPVRSIKLSGNRERIGDLANCPQLERLEALSLSSLRLGAKHWPAFFDSPHLGNLVELNLSHNSLGRAGYAALAACESPTNLRRLNLEKTGFREEAAASFTAWPLVRRLETLGLMQNHADFDGLFVGGLADLRVLLLGESGFNEDSAIALARSGCRLRSFDIGRSELSPESLRTLLDAGVFDEIEELSLCWQWTEATGVERCRLLAEKPLPNLRRLDLYRSGVKGEGLDAILGAPWAGQIASLDLFDNDLGDEGIRAVRQAALPHLVECELGGNDPSAAVADEIKQWMQDRNLVRPNHRKWLDGFFWS